MLKLFSGYVHAGVRKSFKRRKILMQDSVSGKIDRLQSELTDCIMPSVVSGEYWLGYYFVTVYIKTVVFWYCSSAIYSAH
jgi:hypothetical protein